MRRRPVYSKDLGDFLVQQREARGWNQSEAADLAQRRGLTALTRQVLLRLERGQTKHPAPDVMRAVASLYGLDYANLVNRFVTKGFGLVIGAEPGASSALDAANARVIELEIQNSDARAVLGRVSKLTAALAAAVSRDDAIGEVLDLWPQLMADDRASIIEVMKGYRESGPHASGGGHAEEHEQTVRRRRSTARGRPRRA